MHRRLTQSRMERLERTLGPTRTGPPPCPGCGAPDAEIVRLVILDVDESIEHCAVCERALDPISGRPLSSPYHRLRVVTESDFAS
jgi:hypothetical protein